MSSWLHSTAVFNRWLQRTRSSAALGGRAYHCASWFERELAPYASDSNAHIKGPQVILSAEAAQTTASVLHELTTNAAKYGALSKQEGRVSVRWCCAPTGGSLVR